MDSHLLYTVTYLKITYLLFLVGPPCLLRLPVFVRHPSSSSVWTRGVCLPRHPRVPGKKTIISISFNFLSTSRYLLTILPCLPDCWIQINITVLFHILCVWSTSRNRRSDHQQSDSVWVGRIHSRNSWTIYDVSSLLHLHQHQPPLPYPPSPVLLRRWLPVPWPDQRHSLAWRRSATVFSYNAHSIYRCNLISIPRKDLKSPSSFHSFLAKHCSGQRWSGLKPVILPNHSITLYLISEKSLDGHTVIPPQVISFITSGRGLSPSRIMHWGSERSRLPAVGMNAHWSPLTAKD